MGALKDKLLAPGVRPRVLEDCVQVIDAEVQAKGGLTGLAIKGAYKMVKTVGPSIIRDSMDGLLDDFAGRLEPIYDEWKEKGAGQKLQAYMAARTAQVANALLGITDDRARRANSGTLKKAYETLRPTGQKHVEEAVPRIGGLLEKYAA
ncbi:MAG: hypothetical protein HY904_16610 [Deltaproteobacteria bacterium]|nr:hypothetical protein [Deltaproteobacteria bacterium]